MEYKFLISDVAKFFVEYQEQAGLTNISDVTEDTETTRNLRSAVNAGIVFPIGNK